MSMLANRLVKNQKRLKSWLKSEKVQAYRLYDRDIPEIPLIIDRYKDHFVVYDRSDERLDEEAKMIKLTGEVYQVLEEIFGVKEEKIVFKTRRQRSRGEQYEKLAQRSERITVEENGLLFGVNLWDYLDTGLFLDHRPLRKWVKKESADKKVLNLFCYTGSISVAAAYGGGTVTSVDLSKTYINWTYDNFRLNNLTIDDHHFINRDVLSFLREARVQGESWDLIVLDPPTYSNSKKMDYVFDIAVDHPELLEFCSSLLAPGGSLYFSCNKRGFKLDESWRERAQDLTKKSIPQDFRDQHIHCCFKFGKC
jgi:23S rRNA (cytosine1962-C5)-methyltransferase